MTALTGEVGEPWEAAQLQRQPIPVGRDLADLVDILANRPRRQQRHDCRAPRDDPPVDDDIEAFIARIGG